MPLCNEQQLAEARLRFPLFYDACLPNLPDYEQGARCAVVADEDHTVLAVMHQRPPFTGEGATVTLGALVVARRSGLGRLLAFLRRFHAEVCAWVPRVSVNLQQLATMQLGDGLTRADVEQALRGHTFRPAPAVASGRPWEVPAPAPDAAGDPVDEDLDVGESPIP